MKIWIHAKTRAKQPGIKRIAYDVFEVAVAEEAQDGKANAAIIKALAKHLGITSLDIVIKSGFTQRRKLVEVAELKLPPWESQSSLMD